MAGRFPYGLLSLDDPMTQRKPLMGLLSQGQGMQRQPLPGNGMSVDTIMPAGAGLASAFAPQNASAGSLLNMIPDAPAPDAANAGPAPSPVQSQQQPGAPMQLHPQDAAPPQWSQQNDAVQAGMVGSEAEPQGGILGGFGKALGALSNVYGGGGPGDGLINLGIAVGSPGNLLQNVARANEMTARSNQQQQKTQALNQTARLASEKLGISYEQALGALQSGGGTALLSQIFKTPEKPQLVDVRNTDGSISQQWLRPGQTSGVQVGAARPGETVSDVTDPAARAAAGIPADYRGPVQRDATGKLLMPGRPVAEVSIKGESKYDETLNKSLADEHIGIIQAGRNAPGKIARYEALGNALSNTYTGTGGQTVLQLKRMAKSAGMNSLMGVPVDDVGEGEFAQALGNQLALELRNPAGGAGMPGALSDKDREFLQASIANIDKTPEGNKKLVEMAVAVERRNEQVSKLASEYAKRTGGRLNQGFYDELAAWSAQNPLLPNMEAPAARQQQTQPKPATPYERPSWRRAQ